jgi:hypothetical protein
MTNDLARRVVVTLAYLIAIVGNAIGVGAFGGAKVQEAAGGAMAADATLVAPGPPAFSIWFLIYVGLLGYVVWQWRPANQDRAEARATGWLVSVAMVLNTVWLLLVQAAQLWLSVLVIASIAVILGFAARALGSARHRTVPERLVVDGTLGVYLGWVSVATVGAVTATLVDSGITLGSADPWIAAVVLIAGAGGIGALLAVRLGGRYAIAGAMAWGLAWVAIQRLTGAPASTIAAVAALVAAAVVVAAAVAVRRRMVTA